MNKAEKPKFFSLEILGETMKRSAVLILSIILIATGAIFIFAQKGDNGEGNKGFGRHGGKHRGGHEFFLRGLDLTDEQQTQVKQIAEASRKKNKSVHEQMRTNHQKLDELTANGAFDEAQVTAIANQQGALSAQMIVEKERTKSQIFALLTDEQKAKAAQIKEQMKERFKNRMEKSEE
jgi:Spy/CpxP family protein refolding chaperone